MSKNEKERVRGRDRGREGGGREGQREGGDGERVERAGREMESERARERERGWGEIGGEGTLT